MRRSKLDRESLLNAFDDERHRSVADRLLGVADESGAIVETYATGVGNRVPCSRWKKPVGVAWFSHLPYSHMQWFPTYAAFNLGWHEQPERRIWSYVPPTRGFLTKPGMANHSGDHSPEYPAFPKLELS